MKKHIGFTNAKFIKLHKKQLIFLTAIMTKLLLKQHSSNNIKSYGLISMLERVNNKKFVLKFNMPCLYIAVTNHSRFKSIHSKVDSLTSILGSNYKTKKTHSQWYYGIEGGTKKLVEPENEYEIFINTESVPSTPEHFNYNLPVLTHINLLKLVV